MVQPLWADKVIYVSPNKRFLTVNNAKKLGITRTKKLCFQFSDPETAVDMEVCCDVSRVKKDLASAVIPKSAIEQDFLGKSFVIKDRPQKIWPDNDEEDEAEGGKVAKEGEAADQEGQNPESKENQAVQAQGQGGEGGEGDKTQENKEAQAFKDVLRGLLKRKRKGRSSSRSKDRDSDTSDSSPGSGNKMKSAAKSLSQQGLDALTAKKAIEEQKKQNLAAQEKLDAVANGGADSKNGKDGNNGGENGASEGSQQGGASDEGEEGASLAEEVGAIGRNEVKAQLIGDLDVLLLAEKNLAAVFMAGSKNLPQDNTLYNKFFPRRLSQAEAKEAGKVTLEVEQIAVSPLGNSFPKANGTLKPIVLKELDEDRQQIVKESSFTFYNHYLEQGLRAQHRRSIEDNTLPRNIEVNVVN